MLRTEVCHASQLIPLRSRKKRTLRLPRSVVSMEHRGPSVRGHTASSRRFLLSVALVGMPALLLGVGGDPTRCPRADEWQQGENEHVPSGQMPFPGINQETTPGNWEGTQNWAPEPALVPHGMLAGRVLSA